MNVVAASLPACVVVVMGVSGSGKTLVATLLAERLHSEFADADAFHSAANLRKLRSGHPLTDLDRRPWLRALASWIDAVRGEGRRGVLACSALKRSYRETLTAGRDGVRLVYLRGDAELISRRMKQRHGHFMPSALLQSQLDTLEEPQADENPVVVSIDADPDVIVAEIIVELGMRASPC
ncbi:MAG: gluconokinase [Methylibium sp.]|nr:gluconokinase [Methylibium sp.]